MDICNGSGLYGGTLFSGVLCAGGMNGEQDACVVRTIFFFKCKTETEVILKNMLNFFLIG